MLVSGRHMRRGWVCRPLFVKSAQRRSSSYQQSQSNKPGLQSCESDFNCDWVERAMRDLWTYCILLDDYDCFCVICYHWQVFLVTCCASTLSYVSINIFYYVSACNMWRHIILVMLLFDIVSRFFVYIFLFITQLHALYTLPNDTHIIHEHAQTRTNTHTHAHVYSQHT